MNQTAADVAEQTEQPKYEQNNDNGPQHGQSFPFELSFPPYFSTKLFRNAIQWFFSGSHGRPSFDLFVLARCKAILEDNLVSAFKNFFMSLSTESFSRFVFDTVQSESTNKLKSRK